PAESEDVYLVPVGDLPVRLEDVRVANRGEQRRLLPVGHRRSHALSARRAVWSGRNAATRAGTAFDQRAGIGIGVVDVRLVPASFPFRSRIAGHLAELHRAKLQSAVRPFPFEFQLAL